MIVRRKLGIGVAIAVGLGLLVCGCASLPAGVPAGAKACANGAHPGCTSPSRGMVYVVDKTSGTLVYSGRIEGNQDVSVDPAGGQVTVDGSPVPSSPVARGHEFEIYFDPTSGTPK